MASLGFVARMGTGIKNSVSSIGRFFKNVIKELKNVRWPTRKELQSYTIVVIVTLIFFVIYFAVLDFGISEVVKLIVR